jgi:anti-anti-sigma factor
MSARHDKYSFGLCSLKRAVAEAISGDFSMSITSTTSTDGSELVIAIDGRFDFSSHQAFRRAYEDLGEKPDVYSVDMNAASYLDSSALGMLLLLRDFAGGDNADISLLNCNDDVRKILTISNFEQLFTIK